MNKIYEETKKRMWHGLMTHPLFLLSFYEIVQQSLAGIFQERDNELEVAVVAVVWIGHGGVFTMVGQEISHAHHLVLVSLAGSHGGDGAVVLVVHYYDGFESPEI